MNDNIKAIFNKYIENFEHINNNENREYYKWELAQAFQSLDLDSEDLYSELYTLWRKSENIIDNSKQLPFYAILKYTKKEPDTVRQMFKELFTETKDLDEKKAKIDKFIKKTEVLRDRYELNSFRYENDLRSVMLYLFFRNPNENYMYKATEACKFAKYFEYYDDWGPMHNFNLKKYYRMCDLLVEEFKKYPELIATNKSRYDIKGLNLHPDENLHILAFDMMYTANEYGFYTGIYINPNSQKEKKLYEERVKKAKQLQGALDVAVKDYEQCLEAEKFVDETFKVGSLLTHKVFGEGVVEELEDGIASVSFKNSSSYKFLGIYTSYANGIVCSKNVEENERIIEYKNLLKRRAIVENVLKRAGQEIEPYLGYLD